jgi:hypothetical protein
MSGNLLCMNIFVKQENKILKKQKFLKYTAQDESLRSSNNCVFPIASFRYYFFDFSPTYEVK